MQGMNVMQGRMPRKVWIDYLKVLGMVLIVWGHCAPAHLSAFAYAFDVQLFFWVSGYLTKNKFVPWEQFVKKIWQTLFVPMLLICLIALCLSAMMGRCSWTDLPESLLLVLSGFHSFDDVAGCGAMWFVYSLMVIRTIHNLTVLHRKWQPWLCLLFLSLAILWRLYGVETASAWIDVLLAYPFFCLGNMCANGMFEKIQNRIASFTPPIIRKSKIIMVVMLAIAVYIVAMFNGIVYMYRGEFGGSILLFLMGSLLGILMMVTISEMLERKWKDTIAVLSSGTILMLGFQSHFFRIMTAVLVKVGIQRDFWTFDILTLIGSFAIVLAFYPIIKITKRHAPILMGMRK